MKDRKERSEAKNKRERTMERQRILNLSLSRYSYSYYSLSYFLHIFPFIVQLFFEVNVKIKGKRNKKLNNMKRHNKL